MTDEGTGGWISFRWCKTSHHLSIINDASHRSLEAHGDSLSSLYLEEGMHWFREENSEVTSLLSWSARELHGRNRRGIGSLGPCKTECVGALRAQGVLDGSRDYMSDDYVTIILTQTEVRRCVRPKGRTSFRCVYEGVSLGRFSGPWVFPFSRTVPNSCGTLFVETRPYNAFG